MLGRPTKDPYTRTRWHWAYHFRSTLDKRTLSDRVGMGRELCNLARYSERLMERRGSGLKLQLHQEHRTLYRCLQSRLRNQAARKAGLLRLCNH